MTESVR